MEGARTFSATAQNCKRNDSKLRKCVHSVRRPRHALRDLLCALRVGLNLDPQSGEFDHPVEPAGVAGDLDGAGDDSGVSGAHREVGVGLAGELDPAALQRHFGEQQYSSGCGSNFNMVILRRDVAVTARLQQWY